MRAGSTLSGPALRVQPEACVRGLALVNPKQTLRQGLRGRWFTWETQVGVESKTRSLRGQCEASSHGGYWSLFHWEI